MVFQHINSFFIVLEPDDLLQFYNNCAHRVEDFVHEYASLPSVTYSSNEDETCGPTDSNFTKLKISRIKNLLF